MDLRILYTNMMIIVLALLICGCEKRGGIKNHKKEWQKTPEMQQIPIALPPASTVPVMTPVRTGNEQAVAQMPASEQVPAKAQAAPKTEAAPQVAATTAPKQEEKKEQSKQVRKKENLSNGQELNFEVENQTGKTIYVTCFSYIRKRPFSRWRWDKSPVYKIEDNQHTVVELTPVPDPQDRDNVYGYLGVFDNQNDAQDSTYELLDDNKKIDLDIVSQLKDKKVTIEIEKYGIAGEFYDYDFVNKKKVKTEIPKLDFDVENKTGKTIYVTCFVYEKRAKGTWLAQKTRESWITDKNARDDMSAWRYTKTAVIKLKPDEIGKIHVDTIIEPRDREYVRGTLAIFDEDEKEMAEESTYELVSTRRKLELDRLINLKNKKISVYTEKYGVTGSFIDFVAKPTQKPDVKKFITRYFK